MEDQEVPSQEFSELSDDSYDVREASTIRVNVPPDILAEMRKAHLSNQGEGGREMEEKSSSFEEGWALARKGEHAKAVEPLLNAVREDSQNIEALNLLGKVNFHLGRTHEARSCWQKAMEIDPGNAVAYSCLKKSEPKTKHYLVPICSAVVAVVLTAGVMKLTMGGKKKEASPGKAIQSSSPEVARAAKAEESVEMIEPTTKSADLAMAFPDPTERPHPTEPPPTPVQETSVREVSPVAEELPSGPEPEEGDVDRLIEDAYRRTVVVFKLGEHERAETTFLKLEREGVPAFLQDNVLFWLGECAYVAGRYDEARIYFGRVVSETTGNKIPEAEVMADLCLARTQPTLELRKHLEASLNRDDIPSLMKEGIQRCLDRLAKEYPVGS